MKKRAFWWKRVKLKIFLFDLPLSPLYHRRITSANPIVEDLVFLFNFSPAIRKYCVNRKGTEKTMPTGEVFGSLHTRWISQSAMCHVISIVGVSNSQVIISKQLQKSDKKEIHKKASQKSSSISQQWYLRRDFKALKL